MEIQLQIYLVIGVGGFFLLALILSNSLLIYYVAKLYKKLPKGDDRSSPEPIPQSTMQSTAYNNPAMNFDDELNRRFTQYTPEPTMQRITTQNIHSNQGTLNSQKGRSVIDVSEEFRFRHTDSGIRQDEKFESVHEGRTYFTEREFN